MDLQTTRTWAEIDLGALIENYNQIRNTLPEDCRFLGVVKADGYGHGAIPVAKALKAAGAEFLAVACLSEGIALRDAGIEGSILVLGHTPVSLVQGLLDYNLTSSVGNLEEAIAFAQVAHRQRKCMTVHLKVDSGMSRLGWVCHEDTIQQVTEEIATVTRLKGLYVEGLFTHFANSDGDERYTKIQQSRFETLIDGLKSRGLSIEIYHCANSGAVVYYPETHMDMVRPGIALYGYEPNPAIHRQGGITLTPVMTVKSKIYSIKDLPIGTSISYGCTHTLDHDAKIAVVPMGYADGLPRLASGKISFFIHGEKAPVVGRICMDMCMIDVTHIPDIAVGDEVEIYGNYALLEDVATVVDTISYELVCQVAPRVPRVYIQP